MKFKILLILFVPLAFFACSAEYNEMAYTVNEPELLRGCYAGEYERDGEFSEVSLNLVNGFFEGSSGTIRFPAICEGSYYVQDTQIVFASGCVWTADFDWSLILDGTFGYEVNDSMLLFSRKTDTYEEYYRLARTDCGTE